MSESPSRPSPRKSVAATPSELAASPQAKCQQRIKLRIVQEMVLKKQERADEESKRQRAHEMMAQGAKVAAQRIQARRQLALKTLDDGVELLILNQPSSIEAMNVARMLSPRFAEHVSFSPAVPTHSKADFRVKSLLENDRIGAFYR
ncbi:hypothetical protein SDRG_14431 [Saprolegnia diclina VS20]|uniref:Uncharacterized protein n=1 Tax=Saprolegnia diclina (strain VS20) TaxID=1156394 RepID=T0Q362_SAPDV|nr:hypothetical protein SDRG_14431 [Saprolegnia diclina VS20]EQC27850.1 hypothetical protein SDRG_14431 [Saprolegnia diclina VS20]|eukprot:XP_008618780.1 hypothetical protein SDRG_14431 [Saprolegnia diclina VS20]